MVPFSFAGEAMLLAAGRAVYWPREQALLVADLHLEKASFFARHGQFLPPYDSRETLERVALAIRETGARRVITLGDNFHDPDGAARLDPHVCGMLQALTRAVHWVWITGNHDGPATSGAAECGGERVEELQLGRAVLRHIARAGEVRPEMSGHFHPRVQVRVGRRRISRPCAVLACARDGAERLVLPAFGTLTGGMAANDPAIIKALQPAEKISAVLRAGDKLVQFRLWERNA
ncbi:ligase-associated DNA damage response endonuclease PdeM [Erythrobacteraceae bacterium CFH 75059]|uniref:ligase-associated DNA damage response endonuclease PdeM n=1 Tax=Qipengyuania thermophila TaxID=2509361 RepID=UPI0010218A5C|nr:ligase-associated DNA damage response endonuclease PdeM [Qipengyuania thermophila]TCD06271.1 ligase-associated DNA damage response endonuclease PdeM [Erythrobacteraceae bacterium CFH 75059]